MSNKEAKARIKINKLLEGAGWRFFDDEDSNANIQLENNVKITKTHFDEFGEDFEKTSDGFIDFLLLDDKGFPLVVLEAKREGKNPLDAKEQVRKYAKSINVRMSYSPMGICTISGIWKVEIHKSLLNYQPNNR